MNRREALLAASALVVAPLVQAQPERMRRIGLLLPSASSARIEVPLSKRLAALGWVTGRNLEMVVRNAEDHLDRLPALAAQLVALKPEVIVVGTIPATRAVKAATGTIPIVFTWVGDPVAAALVESLARPGGNATGLSNMVIDTAPKQFELLKALQPSLARVAELYDPNYAGGPLRARYKELAQRAGVTLIPVACSSAADLESAFTTAVREGTTAMVINPLPLYAVLASRIAQLAIRHRIVAIAQTRIYPDAGGLLSYGGDLFDQFLRTAGYVDRILRGARPADLPVEQPDRFQLVINLKAAKALGLSIPQIVLLQATEVIE